MPTNAAKHTPVIVGVAQNEQRITNWEIHKEPLELMYEALQAAAVDSSNPKIIEAATAVRVVRGRWPYTNPAAILRERLNLPGAETAISQFGGNFVQTVVNQTALDIQNGTHDVVLITGAECGNTQAKAKRAGAKLRWEALGGAPDRVYGEEVSMAHPEEMKCQIGAPIQLYAMFENALGHAIHGPGKEARAAHLRKVAELWASFSAVATNNPHAWVREAKTAESLLQPTGGNRPVSQPYPKFLNSNSSVDQGAALIMCSTEKARELGISEDRWVYLYAGTDAHDTYHVSNRDNLYSSPAIRHAGNRCLELAGVQASELGNVDLYSCFPVAVQVAARELGLADRTPLTVTGGLTFAGGPLNNYVMHSIATTVELSRAQPGSKNLVTANGGFLTKHAFGLYSGDEPTQSFAHEDLQAQVDAEPTRELIEGFAGQATVETYTVMYDGDGPRTGHIAALTHGGERVWGSVHDKDQVGELAELGVNGDVIGRPVSIADHVAELG